MIAVKKHGEVNSALTESCIVRHIERGRFKIPYRIEGQGLPTIVIGSSIYYPRIFSAHLRKHLRLIFIDHRGFISEPKTVDPDEFSMDVILADIDALRNHLKLKKMVVIGHSGHGFMALEYAKKYPQYVSHLVLVGMGPNNGGICQQAADQYFADHVCPDRKQAQEEQLKRLSDDLVNYPERRFISFCLRLGPRSWYDFRFDASPLWQGVDVNMPIIDYLWGSVFRDIDITNGLSDVNIPILLALGQYDFLVAPFFMWNSLRDQFKNLTMRLFEKSGHTPPFEEPELFDEVCLNFIQGNI